MVKILSIEGNIGSGKSTLLRLLLGLDNPTYGDILYEGQPIHDLDLQEIRRQGQFWHGPAWPMGS